MNLYRQSKYNIISSSMDGGILISNSLYNVHIKIKDKDKEDAMYVLEYPNEKLNSKGSYLHKIFVKKQILVPISKNEKAYVDYCSNKMVFSDDVLHLTILPTDACNFRCQYCYQYGTKHSMSEETVNALKKFLTKAATKYKGMFISWYGGEPTLEKKKVIDVMQHAKNVCRSNGIPLYGQMTTNGYELTEDAFETFLDNHIMSYMVTLDGIQETHNKQRPHVDNPDSYSVIMNNLKAIKNKVKKNNFRVGIRINISPNILPFLREYVDTISSEFGHDKRFGIIWEWVKDWGGERICNNYDLVMDSFERTEYEKYLDYVTENNLQIDRGQAHSQLGSEMCIASRKNGFTVNYDGKVYKCAMGIYDSELEHINCVGEILPNGNMIIDEYKNSIWVGQGDIDPGCGECKHYPECMGLLCPLASKIRNVFFCTKTLNKEESFMARNMEKMGIFKIVECD